MHLFLSRVRNKSRSLSRAYEYGNALPDCPGNGANCICHFIVLRYRNLNIHEFPQISCIGMGRSSDKHNRLVEPYAYINIFLRREEMNRKVLSHHRAVGNGLFLTENKGEQVPYKMTIEGINRGVQKLLLPHPHSRSVERHDD